MAKQYVMSLQMIRASSLCGMNELWAQPFSMLTLIGINVPESAQTATRVVAGLATLVLCWQARRRHSSVRAVEYLLSFATLYILLCNPRTENNTYAMLGPVIGIFAAPLNRKLAPSPRHRLSGAAVARAGRRGRSRAGLRAAGRAHLAQAFVGDPRSRLPCLARLRHEHRSA